MGPRFDIVNPVLWEIGHVGWFHEYWMLAPCPRPAPLIERGDRLWDPAQSPHATRWHSICRPAGAFAYLADVLARQATCWLAAPPEARYFYELGVRHEDMHVEALTYSRQTLSYAPPPELDEGRHAGGRLAGRRRRAGRDMAAGLDQAADGFVFDNEKWAHETALTPFASPARR